MDIFGDIEELIFGPKSEIEKNLKVLNKKAEEYETILNKLFDSYKGKDDQNAAREFYMKNYQTVKGYDDFLTQLLIKADQLLPQNDTQRQLRRKEIAYIQQIQKNSDQQIEKIKTIMLKDVIIPLPQDVSLDLDEKIKILEIEAQDAIKEGEEERAGDLGYTIYSLKASKNKKIAK